MQGFRELSFSALSDAYLLFRVGAQKATKKLPRFPGLESGRVRG
jgi:hypothetical protein